MSKRSVVLTIVSLTALALLALGSPALAKDGDVLVRGTCTGTSTSKLKLSTENGRIEVEFEVDQNRNGVRWNVVLTRDSARIAQLARVTRAPSGSFEARRLVANPAGADVVRQRLTGPARPARRARPSAAESPTGGGGRGARLRRSPLHVREEKVRVRAAGIRDDVLRRQVVEPVADLCGVEAGAPGDTALRRRRRAASPSRCRSSSPCRYRLGRTPT